MKRTFILTVLIGLALTAMAGKGKGKDEIGYKFVLTIHNNHDTVMYLGNYYAGNTYATDTAYLNKKGQFVFERKNRRIMPGLYFFTNPGGNYVEFMVYHETPNFVFETDERGWTQNMVVKGSKENELFYQYHRTNHACYTRVDSAKIAGVTGDELKALQHKVARDMDSVKEMMIAQNPNSMLALMMNSTREPYVPTVDSTGQKMSDRDRYFYYIDHYFDNMRLDDDALVRTPDMIFHRPVMDYLDKNLKGASAEMVIEYVDKLIERSRPSKEVFKYLVHTIAEKYLQSNVMSYDAVYVHMIQKYYATGEAFWASPSVIDEQTKRANTWERLLIGKKAPELVMKDMNGYIVATEQMQTKYTLVVFWSPTCGHCKVIIPDLYEKFLKYKDRCDIGAFAILSEPDETTRPKWREFVETRHMNDPRWHNVDGGEANIDWHEVYDIETTPQIYLLDKNKKIVAKRLNAETFETIIKLMEGIE